MPKADLSTPVVVDLTRERCPEVDPRIRAEFGASALKKAVERPAPRVCPEDGQHAVCQSDTRAWIDGLEESVRDKHAAGNILIRDLEACRGRRNRKARSRPRTS